jgi:hypothetical protein
MAAEAAVAPKRRMFFAQVYFCDEPYTRLANYRYAVRDAQFNGFGSAVIIDYGYDNGRRVILDTTSLQSWDVPQDCAEVKFAKPKGYPPKKLADHIAQRYVEHAQRGDRCDYETTAVVLKHMGRPVPEVVVVTPEEGEVHGRTGGKRPEPRLLTRVVRDSRRGQVAEFFAAGPKAIMQAQLDLNMSRSGVLSHLHGLWQYHGIGYQTDGDRAWLVLPPGVVEFWATLQVLAPSGEATTVHAKSSRTSKGKPVVPEKLRPFKADSQRGKVFTLFSMPNTIEAAAKALGITENAVKSHLHSMNSDSGVGYEVYGDDTIKVLVPDGWRPF